MTPPSSQFRRAIVILAAICPLYIISNFFRISNAVIAPDLMSELTLSPEAMGVLTGLFFAGYAAAQIPVGMMLDRFGVRITVPSMMAFTAGGSLLFAVAAGMLDLSLGRFFTGVGCAGVLIGALLLATRWTPPQHFATVSGTLSAIGVFGVLLGTTPFAVTVEAIGWRNSFIGMAVIAVVMAILGYLVVRDAPPGHAFHDRAREPIGEVVRGLGEVLLNPRLPVMFFIGFVSYAAVLTVLGLWGGPYLHDVHGLGLTARGNVLAVMTVALAVGFLTFGPLDRIFDTRKWVTLAGGAGTVVVLGLLALLPQPPLWLVTVLFAALAFLNGFSVTAFAHGRTIFPDRLMGRGLTMLALATFIGVAFMQTATGPIVGAFEQPDGIVSSAGYRWMFAFIAALVALALLFYSRTADAKPSGERAATTS